MFVSPGLTAMVLTVLTLCVGAACVLAVQLRRVVRACAVVDRLRLASHDVRGVGMTLHGHADHLTAEGHDDAAGIAAAAADLLDLADDLHDLTMEAAAPRVLRVESVPLGDVV